MPAILTLLQNLAQDGQTTVKEEDPHKVYIKDRRFLDRVKYYYWNDLNNMAKLEFSYYARTFIFDHTVYAVDVSEKTLAEKIKIYQVENMSIKLK